ncbi:hypothetical protein ELH70_14700 [Rhizobium ruizarguesonis]|uniref:hypothetical protein n=1 Tax=Rhizobium ruizarguesonis TaxID=2081791 RepID=UPI001030F844|nr:hypothetical protein [Rhizobium ruizarguesonis]TAZ73816.1 hypothetical protein ELH70_14700 [Rhizobium ruizarguesonis]TBA00417.1 hypothetical protein ELH69_13885 [Rhizobium ruizarguesonis]
MKIPDITDEQWLRIRSRFGDLAYEHPEMHHIMLELLDTTDIEVALEKPPKRCVRTSRRVWPNGWVAELDRGDSVSVEATIKRAKAILDSVPDVPADLGDGLK